MNRLTSVAKTTFLLSLVTGLFLAVGYLLGQRTGAFIALLFAGVFNFGTYWFSDKLVLKMQGAKPLDTRTYGHIEQMVAELAAQDNLPMPKLYFVDSPIPNAFATGRSPKRAVVAVTRGITELLNKEELRSVLAHELGHVKNRDMLVSTVAATVAGGVSMLAEIAMWSNLFGGGQDNEEGNNPIASLALLILAPISAMLIQMSISRSREYMADRHGAHLIGHGDYLASALQKLEDYKPRMANYQPSPKEQAASHLMFANMFSAQGIGALFSTHPPTKMRIKKLLQQGGAN